MQCRAKPLMRYAMYAFLVAFGSMLIAIAGQVKVPMWPVPTTLQTLAIFTIAAAYGRNLAVATLLAYLAEGAAGLPVFTNGGGLAYFAGPTTGYLIGIRDRCRHYRLGRRPRPVEQAAQVFASPTFLAGR
jgi:biotin transporter BioY